MAQHNTNLKWRSRVGMLVLAGLTGLTGCRSHDNEPHRVGNSSISEAALPPICGPAGILFTNSQGFSAHAEFEFQSPANQARNLSGELLGQGSQLLFAVSGKDTSTRARGNKGVFYIWDVSRNSGYALNEALQGYAPASASLQATNIATTAMPGQNTAKLRDHACRCEKTVLAVSDGTTASYIVWRAEDLKQLPVQVECMEGGMPFKVALSNIRFEAFKAELFVPPNAFTAYASPEAMQAELLRRQSYHGRKSGPATEEPFGDPSRSYQHRY